MDEFKNKYIYKLSLYKKDERANLGQKFHSLICAYLREFNIEKLLKNLSENEFKYWIKLEEYLKNKKQNFIKTEYSFLTKEKLKEKDYYLTGRFDAIYKEKDEYIIYDWKTLNLPKNPENDMQSVVYLYAFEKIFKTKKVKIKYLSIEKLEFVEVEYKGENAYKIRIDEIVSKIYT